jgi:hypothetical protein
VNQRQEVSIAHKKVSKVRSNVSLLRRTVTGDRISGYRAPGTKLTRTIYRLQYGTRELIVVLLTAKDANVQGWHETIGADQPVVVMKLAKVRGAKELTCLVSK